MRASCSALPFLRLAGLLLAAPAIATAQPTSAQRVAAATATAASPVNACNAVRPFYWEVGTSAGRSASGSVPGAAGTPVYTAASRMAVASASKWVWGAYVVQKAGGVPSALDRRFLSMRSGYRYPTECQPGQTVDACLAQGQTNVYDPAADGRFWYEGGHFQKHASVTGLGGLDAQALTLEVRSQIGRDVAFAYAQARPGGGLVMTPAAYALFLRKLLDGRLLLGPLLGSEAACANPRSCAAGEALYSPLRDDSRWHYTLGHWVEDDPTRGGDGAFSSAGAFGFYPWIDAAKTHYGIVARVAEEGSGWASSRCGQAIRRAWQTGTAQ